MEFAEKGVLTNVVQHHFGRACVGSLTFMPLHIPGINSVCVMRRVTDSKSLQGGDNVCSSLLRVG